MLSPFSRAKIPTMPHASCRRSMFTLPFAPLCCSFSRIQFPCQVRDQRIAVGNPLQVLPGHGLQIAVDLLIEHSVLVTAGPEPPAIVINNVSHHQITGVVATKFNFEVDQRHIDGCPGSFQGLKYTPPLLRHPLDLCCCCQSHGDDILWPDLRVMARIVLEKRLD